MSENVTRIQRSAKATVGYAVGGAIALGISGLLFWQIASGPVTVGIALCPGILGVILFGMAIGGSGVAPARDAGPRLRDFRPARTTEYSARPARNSWKERKAIFG